MRTHACKRFNLSSVFAAIFAFSLAAQPFCAKALTIDDFKSGNHFVKAAAGETKISTVGASTVVGGFRTLRVEDVTAPVSQDVTLSVDQFVSPGIDGMLSHSQDVNAKGRSTIIWDGDNSNAVDFDGLGGLDLTEDGGTKFTVRVEQFDYPSSKTLDLVITVYDASDATGNKSSQATIPLSAIVNSTTDFFATFASFTQTPGSTAAADFTNVGAITMQIKGNSNPAFDLAITWFGTDGKCVQVPVVGGVVDDCGVCAGTNADKDDCGVCFGGNADKDDCGQCFHNNSDKDVCGVCFGLGKDACNLCPSDPDYGKNLCVDCNSVPFGGAVVDECNVCQGLGKDKCGLCPSDPGFGTNGCFDCKGVPNGAAVVDHCNVCDGDGTSCEPCEDFNIYEKQFILDGGAKDQERLIDYILDKIDETSDEPHIQNYIEQKKVEAHNLQERNWIISWTFPSIGTTCPESVNACVSVDNGSLISEYTVHSKSLRKLTNKVLGVLKNLRGGQLRPKEQRLRKRGNKMHKTNMENLKVVPPYYSKCV